MPADGVCVHNDERFGLEGPELRSKTRTIDPTDQAMSRSGPPPNCWHRSSTSRAVSLGLPKKTRAGECEEEKDDHQP
jgi:hypothetical protein